MLLADLRARAEVYAQEPDPLLRRNKSNAMLGSILNALQMLPNVETSEALLPLKDLMIFLQDLDIGRQHPWARPVNFGGTNVTPTAEKEMRQWAVAFTHILWSTGMGKTEAYRIVANALTESGRGGKDNGPVRWRSVQQWYRNKSDPLDSVAGKRLADWWQTARCPHGQLATNCDNGHWSYAHCPHAKEIAIEGLHNIFSIPHLRDRFDPGVSD